MSSEHQKQTATAPMDPETERHVRQMKLLTNGAQLVIMVVIGGFAAAGLIAATN